MGAHQHVARRDAGPGGRATRRHLAHPQAARPLPAPQVLRARHVESHPGASYLAEASQLVRHTQSALDRNREPDPYRAARAREDRAVDSDDLAQRIRERAARVAGVDRRVGLDHADVDPGLSLGGEQVPAHGAHHSGRDGRLGVAQEVGERVADRDYPFADQQVGALAERRGRQARGVELEHGDVGERVLAQDLRGKVAPVTHRDDDLLGTLRDVLVGDHHAVGRDDESRPVSFHHLLRAARQEEQIKRVLRHAPLAPQHVHTHHGGREPGGRGDDGSLARAARILRISWVLGTNLWRRRNITDRHPGEQDKSSHMQKS